MKATPIHVAMLAVVMYGLSQAAFLYGQSKPVPPEVHPPGSNESAKPAALPTTPGPFAAPEKNSDGSVSAADAAKGSESSDSDRRDEYRTVRLKYAGASFLAKQLKELAPAFTHVIGDDRTNQIVIRGPKEGIETVVSLIQQLDLPDVEKSGAAPFFGFGPGTPGVGLSFGPPGSTSAAFAANIPVQPAIGTGSPSWLKAWDAYAKWLAGSDEPVQKQVIKMREMLDQLNAAGEAKSAQAQELQSRIDHLLGEQLRRANESAQRATEQANQADQDVQKMQDANQGTLDQSVEQERHTADDARRAADQARRTIEQLQRAMESRDARSEQYMRASQAARQASDLQGRIEATARTVREYEQDSDLTPERKSALDRCMKELNKLLSTQFDQQEKAETEELKQLRQRLDKLEKEISDRAQNRDEIIKHRLDDLASANASSQPDSGNQPETRITTSNLILQNVPGAGTLHIDSIKPGTVTISAPGTLSATAPNSPDAARSATATISSSEPRVLPASIELKVTGPETAHMGEDVRFEIEVTNHANVDSENLTLSIRHAEGLQHEKLNRNPIQNSLGSFAPGETKKVGVTFHVISPGKLDNVLELKGPGMSRTKIFSVNVSGKDKDSDTQSTGK